MSAWSPEHITLRRTENGNVIAHDSRDDQEFIFAECCSEPPRVSWRVFYL